MSAKVELYTKSGCSLCVVAREIILKVGKEIPFEFQEVDIETRRDLYDRFKDEIPVVFINGEQAFTSRVNEKKLTKILKRQKPRGRLPKREA